MHRPTEKQTVADEYTPHQVQNVDTHEYHHSSVQKGRSPLYGGIADQQVYRGNEQPAQDGEDHQDKHITANFLTNGEEKGK